MLNSFRTSRLSSSPGAAGTDADVVMGGGSRTERRVELVKFRFMDLLGVALQLEEMAVGGVERDWVR